MGPQSEREGSSNEDCIFTGPLGYIGKEVIIDLTMPVTLKDAASIGARVQIWTHSGYYEGETVVGRNYQENRGEVTIDEGAMIYSNTVLKHGIIVGKFANVTANSMVNRNVEDYATASGVPVKVIQRTK
jgi:acetyltransferase-like isoleucine patch superfamily enzyme